MAVKPEEAKAALVEKAIAYVSSGRPGLRRATSRASSVRTTPMPRQRISASSISTGPLSRGADLYRRYGDAFPPAYRDDFSSRVAVADVERIERLEPGGDLDLSLYLSLESPAGHLAFKRSHRGV
jgi:NAD-specific glutamate dehydrogenase